MVSFNLKKPVAALALFFSVLTYFVFGSGWYVPSTLVIDGTAPKTGAELEITWDSGAGWNAYEREVFKVQPKPDGFPKDLYTIRIQATGRKHGASLSEAVVCSRIRIDGDDIDMKGLERTGGHLSSKGIQLSHPNEEIRISHPVTNSIQIELLTNPQAGIARISIDGQTTEHDLYIANIEAKRISIDRWVLQPSGRFGLTFTLPRYQINTLQIKNSDPSRPVHVTSVALNSPKGVLPLGFKANTNPLLSLQFDNISKGLKQYFEPIQFVYQLIYALITTWILLAVSRLVSSRGGVRAILLEKQRYIFWLLFLGASSIYSMWLIVFWPGIMSVDSLKVWRAAVLPEVYLNDHPLLFVFFYKYLRHIWNHVAVVSLFHIALASLLISRIVFSLYREGISIFWLLLFYFTTVFSLPVCLYNIVLWKDIPFALLVIFWAYAISYMYLLRREGRLKLTKEQVAALFLLYVAVALIRHNGIVFLVVIPLFLVGLKILHLRYMLMSFACICFAVTVLFLGLRFGKSIDDAGYLVEKGVGLAKPLLKKSFTAEATRFGKQYWGILNINQTKSKWDLWHYYLTDRQAYWFLRHSGWKDAYPYLAVKPSIFPVLHDFAMKIYWKSYKEPWVYLSWNPVVMLALFPFVVLMGRWLPMSAIFSSFILIQVITLLGIINILNWRYYYFVCLGGYFLPMLVLWDCRYLYLKGDSAKNVGHAI